MSCLSSRHRVQSQSSARYRKIAKERKIAKYCYILTNREIAGDRGRSRNIAKYRGVSRGIEFDERMDPTQLRRLLVPPSPTCERVMCEVGDRASAGAVTGSIGDGHGGYEIHI